MKIIKIKDKKILKEIEGLIKDEVSVRSALDHFSNKLSRIEEKFWRFINSEFPETVNHQARFNYKTREIKLLYKNTEDSKNSKM